MSLSEDACRMVLQRVSMSEDACRMVLQRVKSVCGGVALQRVSLWRSCSSESESVCGGMTRQRVSLSVEE